MNVAELEGALLAEWVARALGFPNANAMPVEQCGWEQIEDESFRKDWAPHEDWEQGGPIIEREQICIYCSYSSWCAGFDLESGDGTEDGAGLICMSHEHDGPTPLVAAMRAYVASKFGDEVADDTK